MEEASAKLANSILLFCKGLGWLTSVNLPGVERRASSDSQVQKLIDGKYNYKTYKFLKKILYREREGNEKYPWKNMTNQTLEDFP